MPLALTLALAATAGAEIYRWTDEAGDVHFSDSLHSVPERYRSQTQTRSSALPPAPAAPPKERRGAAPLGEVPLERHESGFIVQARFNDRETARLILDTGATSTVVSPSFASRAGLTVQWEPPVVLKTAGGELRVGWAEVRSVDVAGHKVGPLKVLVHNALESADGLLGMNFLGAFRVEIRAQGPSLVLSPP